MKILSRYVLKEHLSPLIFSLTALTSLLLLNYVAKQFGNLVGKGIPWTAIGEFFLLSIPFTIALTLPMAVLVATLHAFSRLAAENEVTALKASGVSLQRLMRPVLWAAAGVTAFMVVFNDQVLPRTNHELAVLQTDIAQKKPTFALREQVINEVSPGKLFLRANRIDEGSNMMRVVTIYDLSDATRRRTIYADSGNIALARNHSDLLMTLYRGTMQDVPTMNPAELQRLFFNTDLITVKGVANQFQQSQTGQSKGNREMSVCEMQQEVQKGRKDYLAARTDFVQTLAVARKNKLNLDPQVYNTNTSLPGRVTLGGIYCSLLHTFGVHSLGAQQPAATKPVPAPAPPPLRPTSLPVGRITAAAPPSAGLSPGTDPSVTPSSIEIARIRMNDARTFINGYEIEIHKKFALAVACFVFVLLGAPIALKFPRGGVGMTLGVSIVVFALYYIALTAGAAVAADGILPPALAMWAANIVFGSAGLLLVARMGRSGATNRGGDAGEALRTVFDSIARKLRVAHLLPERRADA
ncbi:MAG: LptF/LptG family permease [Gemmatimonadaceae bacterium]